MGGKGEAEKPEGSDKVYLITDKLPGEQVELWAEGGHSEKEKKMGEP